MLKSTQYLSKVTLQREKIDSFEDYPFCLDVVRNLDFLDFHPKVTFIIGDNGTGKSTLLEAIAIKYGFNPEGGSKNFNFSTHASHSNLHQFVKLTKGYKTPKDGFFLRAESYFNVASEVDSLGEIVNAYGGISLHEQSHGESFLALLLHRLKGRGLYMLDEPEAALSPNSQMAMLYRINQLVNKDSQFIIATHSPILMAYPEAQIYILRQDGIHTIEYTDTEHYQTTKNFLNDHETMLDHLFDGENGDADDLESSS